MPLAQLLANSEATDHASQREIPSLMKAMGHRNQH